MRRTLLAVGIAIILSLMLVPRWQCSWYRATGQLVCGGNTKAWLPFFVNSPLGMYINWQQLWLQTFGLAVAAAVVVNLFPRRPKK